MYAYDLPNFIKGKSLEEIRQFADRIRQLQTTSSSRNADQFFLREVGCTSLPAYNESYYKDVVNFDLALLMAHAGLDTESSDLMSSINGLLPGPGGDILFPEHQRQSLDFYRQQQEAAARGMASVLITSLPKSGSAGLSQSIAGLMQAPVLRLSAGDFPHSALIKIWLSRWHSGGMVTHEHYAATPHNLTTLHEAGVKRLAVQVRDPRSATWSYLSMRQAQKKEEFLSATLEDCIDLFYLPCIQWLQSWLAAKQNAPWLTVHWIKFQDFKSHPHVVMADLLEPLADNQQMRKLVAHLRKGNAKLVQANFHRGDDDAWRLHTSESLRQRMWDALPKSIISFFDLQP